MNTLVKIAFQLRQERHLLNRGRIPNQLRQERHRLLGSRGLENEALVIINAKTPQQLYVFLAERPPGVMRLLVLNIPLLAELEITFYRISTNMPPLNGAGDRVLDDGPGQHAAVHTSPVRGLYS